MYAFLGTCRQLSVAPEAAVTLLVGQAVREILLDLPHSHPDDVAAIKIAICTIITMQVGHVNWYSVQPAHFYPQVGFFAFLLGFFRLGFIDVVLSRALLRGFVTAIAVVITTEQLVPMFGLTALMHEVQPGSTFDKVLFLLEYVFTSANITTTVISFSALAVLVGIRLIKRVFQKYWWIYRLPEVLLVVVCFTSQCISTSERRRINFRTVLSEKFNWDKDGVEIMGAVPITSMKSFVQIPLQAENLKYLRRTTTTSMFGPRIFTFNYYLLLNSQVDRGRRLLGQYRSSEAKRFTVRLLHQPQS